MEQKVDISRKRYGFEVLAKFNCFRKENKYCDFIIKTGDKSMPVHRCVIAASSEYFDAMLSNDTKESREGIVEIQDADSSSIQKCIEFMYTGNAFVCDGKRGDLLHVAHMLRLHRLYNGIAMFLGNKLNYETFFTTKEIANRYDFSRLVEICNDFALKNFRAIAKMDDFKKIDAKYLDFLLSSDRLKESDRGKCKALMVWVNSDSTRAVSLLSMMRHIEFMNVPLSYRRFLMDHEATVSQSNECLKLVMKSVLEEEKVEASDASMDSGIIVLDHKSRKMQCLDVENSIWTEMQDLNWRMYHQRSSVVILDEYLYALIDGGSNYRIKYKECNAGWEAISQRNGHWGLAVASNNCIYVTERDHCSKRIERYNPSVNQWSFIPDRPNAVAHTTVAVADDCLFEFGGTYLNYLVARRVIKFDPESSTWSEAGNLEQERYHASAVTLNNAIYIFGGFSLPDKYVTNLEIFHVKSKTMELVALPNCTRAEFTSHTLDGIIYLVGGDGTKPLTISAYNPKKKALTNVMVMDGIWMGTCESVLAFTN